MRGIPQSRRGRYALAALLLVLGLGSALGSGGGSGSWWAPIGSGLSLAVGGAGAVLIIETARQRRRDGIGDVVDWSSPSDPGLAPGSDGQTMR